MRKQGSPEKSLSVALFSIGTRAVSSLVYSANRAAVYTIKPTIGVVSRHCINPDCHIMESVGSIGNVSYDIAAFLDIFRGEEAPGYPE